VNGSRRRELLGLAGLTLVALTLAAGLATTAQANDKGGVPIPPLDPPQLGSGGNDSGSSADESGGVVQIGPVTVDPASVVDSAPVADTVADTTAAVGSATAVTGTHPAGPIHVGGAGAAVGSARGVRLSSSKARTGRHVRPGVGGAVDPSGPVSSTVVRTSRVVDSAVVAQVGNRHSGMGSSATARSNRGTQGVSPAASLRSARVSKTGGVLRVDRAGSRGAGFAPSAPATSVAATSPSTSGGHALAAAGGTISALLGGQLPYTGLALWFLLLAALAVLLCGRILR
jgi:hypothetical protein